MRPECRKGSQYFDVVSASDLVDFSSRQVFHFVRVRVQSFMRGSRPAIDYVLVLHFGGDINKGVIHPLLLSDLF